ncbi:ThiF family adenylyltransferase [Persicimonas caeni]|uniref:ThiF family adenylyltransferase n=1 Tax=Persicimonas caeni TaxID=2292766 RepID=A0A4Y6PSD1_PERCE|nr:ThiF family adenylyltransferase [Persicimonas caeni]QDG51150.1 ThiF family adenylyltransferase [Persicimonas caeni]QED32371.1 ThiF family adenylyltransferase [Persicimonas caeni]
MAHYLWLLPTVSPANEDGSLVLRGTRKKITISNLGKAGVAALAKLDGTRTEAELLDIPIFELLMPVLEERGWLVRLSARLDEFRQEEPLFTRQLSYYAHLQPFEPDAILRDLKSRTVIVYGMGGIGCHCALTLAGAGVEKMHLIDHDTIDFSNLNRQILYTAEDLGRPKVEVAARELARRFPALELHTHTFNVDRDADVELPEADLIAVCGECEGLYDHPGLVADTPLIRGGYEGCVGLIGPYVDPGFNTPSWRQLMTVLDRPSIAQALSAAIKLPNSWNSSGSTINTLMGGLMGEAAIRILAADHLPLLVGFEELRIDLRDLSLTRSPIAQ